jgi:hypothetical protein
MLRRITIALGAALLAAVSWLAPWAYAPLRDGGLFACAVLLTSSMAFALSGGCCLCSPLRSYCGAILLF